MNAATVSHHAHHAQKAQQLLRQAVKDGRAVGMTVIQLSGAAGVSRPTIYEWLRK